VTFEEMVQDWKSKNPAPEGMKMPASPEEVMEKLAREKKEKDSAAAAAN